MQEFIIQTDDSQNPQSIPTDDQATQQQNIQTPYNNQPMNLADPTDDKSRFLVVILISTLTILLFTIVFISYLHFSNEKALVAENLDNDVLGTETNNDESKTLVDIPSEFENTLFYTDGYNIFSYSLENKQSTQITDLAKNITSQIGTIQILNEDYLGFIKCDLKTTGNTCQVNIYNMKSHKSEILDEVNGDIDNIAWIDEKTYIISEYNPIANTIEINLMRENEAKKLAEIPGSNTSREKYIEDSNNLKISPNKDKVFYINTTSDNGFNFNVYIYNLEGVLLANIEDATHPAWIDDENIAFRRYSNKKAGYLYNFNLETKNTSKIDNAIEAAYNPKVLGQYIAFWEENEYPNIYIYDKQVKDFTLIEEKTAFPTWLSNDTIIFGRTRNCNTNECMKQGTIEYETQFLIESYIVKNIFTGYTEEIDVRKKYLEKGIATWANDL